MPNPRIAIPVPTSFDDAYNRRCWPEYATAVVRSGAEAVKIDYGLSPSQIADKINTCQGILLPGSGADVNSQRYGQQKLETSAPPDSLREGVDELLIQDAHNLYKPILAICFGSQTLNVWRGGTLIQDLNPLPVNHPAGRSVAVAHTVIIAPDSLLGDLLVSDEAVMTEGFLRLSVNSSHHQAIAIPGDGLRVIARCPQDGVIEAVEGGQSAQDGSDHFVLGVQWHPERIYDLSSASRAIFSRFVREAATWKPRSVYASIG